MKVILKRPYTLFRTTCYHCGCVFTYDMSDVFSLGDTVTCPCCGHFVRHDAEDNGIERMDSDETSTT